MFRTNFRRFSSTGCSRRDGIRLVAFALAAFFACWLSGAGVMGLFARADEAAESTVAEARVWKDRTGQFSIEATYVRYEAGRVLLQKSDGQEIAVELGKLSREDQQYVRELVAAQRQSAGAAATAAGGSGRKDDGDRATPVAAIKATAGDWPTWRGVNRDGISEETGLLQEWPEGGPPLAWQVNGLGNGYSSVSVADGIVYTMGRDANQEHLIARKADDGSELWRVAVGPKAGDTGPNCTPTIDGGLVYALSAGGELLCADAKTGKEKWRVSFGRDFGGKMMSGWGYSESPLVDGDRLICTPGSPRAVVAALDKKTGKVIWGAPMPNGGSRGGDGAGYSSIVISRAAGVKQYVQLVGRGVIGVDADKGVVLWRYEGVANGTANIPTPIIDGDFVFCSTGYNDGGSALLHIKKGPAGLTAEEVYYFRSGETQNHHGGMIRIGDHIYMGEGHNNGKPLCLEMKSGNDAWRPGRGPGSGSAALAYADGRLYFRYENGVMALVEATPSEYRIKGQFKLPSTDGPSWPQPVIAGGHLFVRDQDALMCFDLRR